MRKFIIAGTLSLLLTGCSTYRPCTQIDYLSIRPTIAVSESSIPEDASIIVYTILKPSGDVDVVVENLTDDVLTIDQTKSFFINNSGTSIAYYDPTVRTSSNTVSSQSSRGGAFNMGGLASAFGIGGIAGTLLNATTIGGSNSSGNSSTYTTVVADLPQVSIGPRGKMALSKTFKIDFPYSNYLEADPQNSPLKFAVSLNYSFDSGKTWEKITNNFYSNSHFKVDVYNRQTNDAIRKLIATKPNATLEPWFIISSNRGDYTYERDRILNTPMFINYQ